MVNRNYFRRIPATIILWAASAAVVLSQAPPVTTVGQASYVSGRYLVPVTVSGFQNVGNISMVLNYDSTILALADVNLNQGLTAANAFSTLVPDQSGQFRLSCTSPTPVVLVPSDTLLTFAFEVLPGVQNQHTLLTWSTVQGDCEIAPPVPGQFTPPVTTANMADYFINGFIDISSAIHVSLRVFLEGLYNGGPLMRKARADAGDNFPGTIADLISVELHNSADYNTVELALNGLNLNTDGSCSFTVNNQYNGTYYITIRHRNSIPVTSALPVSFAVPMISYDFASDASQVYGSNVKNIGGTFAMFGGDINQDGYIGVIDMMMLDNLASIFATGYMPADVNGDGCVCVTDMTIIDNNSAAFVSVIHPL